MREGEGTPVQFAPTAEVTHEPVRETLLGSRLLPIFAREDLTPELIAEITPLLMAHYAEVSGDLDIPLDPRWDLYFGMQDGGKLLIYTSRILGRLVGYNAFFKDQHMHYVTLVHSANDVIFIDKAERGFGRQFIRWCVDQVRDSGARMMSFHVKLSHDWSHILAEMGFTAREVVWVKRLDK